MVRRLSCEVGVDRAGFGVFVLAGSACHYWAIVLAVLPTTS